MQDYKNNESALGGDLSAQKKFIKETASEFNGLGVQVDNVNDAEQLLVYRAGGSCRLKGARQSSGSQRNRHGKIPSSDNQGQEASMRPKR